MQLIDRPSINIAVNHAAQPISEVNQKTYTRLKTSLKLNLRRQIFLAVCDDLELRDRLVYKLQADLAPQFIHLHLNLADPNPMAQVCQWLNRYSTNDTTRSKTRFLGFQILGIEHLTRQSAPVQKRFLTHLQAIEYYMPCLECSVLLWLPRPWLRSLQQSAPSFWEWHTALFEFEGDPTPVRAMPPKAVKRLHLSEIDSWTGADMLVPPPSTSNAPAISTSPQPSSSLNVSSNMEEFVAEESAIEEKPLEVTPLSTANNFDWEQDTAEMSAADVDDADLLQGHDPLPGVIWDILTHDLAQFDTPPSPDVHPPPESPQIWEKTPQLPNRATVNPTDVTADNETTPSASRNSLPVLSQTTYAAFLQTCQQLLAEEPSQAASVTSPLKPLIQAALAAEPDLEQHQFGLQALQHIEQIQQQGLPQQTLASAYYTLGRGYRECIEQGQTSEHTLKIAISAHEQTISLLSDDSELKANVANDLGNLYWLHSRHAEDSGQLASLEKAIAAYNLALAHTDLQRHPKTGAMIQNNLGSAYGDLAQQQEPAKNLQKAVQAYEAALRYRSFNDDPSRYAATQNNLGTTYWNLAQHQQSIPHLKQAIAAYQEALRYYTADREPLSHAMIQNNIGTAYWNLAQHIQPGKRQPSNLKDSLNGASPDVLLKCAIVAYQNALVYRTFETVPAGYAATQNNLGTAHWDLAMLANTSVAERQERLQAGVVAYEAAIAAVDRLTQQASAPPMLTFDVSATHNNLGLVYFQLASDSHNALSREQRQTYLEAALKNHLQALQGWNTVSDLRQSTIDFIVQTVRSFFNEFGIQGQAIALSQVPPNLLPEIMSKM